jgi:hypothetical protein
MSVNIPVHNGGYANITGLSNSYLTAGNGITMSNTTTWANPATNFNNGNGAAVMSIPYGEDKVVIEKSAALEIKGKVIINGVDLNERLRTIETVLAIPERDTELEAKHPKLKELYDEYINALAKYKTWESLKGSE